MNIDERLEALTQTVELIASLHKDNEERFREYAQATEARFSKLAQAVERNEERAGQLMDTMNRLGRILEIHDETLDEHDERIKRLERPQQ